MIMDMSEFHSKYLEKSQFVLCNTMNISLSRYNANTGTKKNQSQLVQCKYQEKSVTVRTMQIPRNISHSCTMQIPRKICESQLVQYKYQEKSVSHHWYNANKYKEKSVTVGTMQIPREISHNWYNSKTKKNQSQLVLCKGSAGPGITLPMQN